MGFDVDPNLPAHAAFDIEAHAVLVVFDQRDVHGGLPHFAELDLDRGPAFNHLPRLRVNV